MSTRILPRMRHWGIMPTNKQLYTDKLNQAMSRYGAMEDSTVREILAMLEETRDAITVQMMQGATPAGQYQLQAQQAAINRLIDDFERRADALLRQSTGSAFEVGGLSAVEPLQALGFRQAFYTPSIAQLNIMQDYSADLITGITNTLRQSVDREVRQAAIGRITPFQAMQAITKEFGGAEVKQGKMVVSGVSAKAEMDVRTELQAVYNSANQSQMADTATRIDGLLKRWIATGDSRTRRGHLEAHRKYKNNPIPVDEPYKIRNWVFTKKRGWQIKGTAELMYPADLSAPGWASINCRCTQALIAPGIGVIGSSLDGRIGAALKRAEAQ